MSKFNRKERQAELEDGNGYIVDCHIRTPDKKTRDYPLFQKLADDPDDGRLRVRLLNYVLIPKEMLTPKMKGALQPLFKDSKL